jgi:hypothetical protein
MENGEDNVISLYLIMGVIIIGIIALYSRIKQSLPHKNKPKDTGQIN